MSRALPRRRRWLLLSLVTGMLALLASAATPGDIGGCGTPVADLDPPVFFDTKKSVDCEACRECSISSQSCRVACDEKPAAIRSFPEGCFPLTHDGVVCLRALLHASCSDYERYMSDDAPETPTECNFCPEEAKP